jgi:hypothetical protein
LNHRRRTTSVKPGRAPSLLGGIGSLIAICFGVLWTIMARQITKDAPFGIVGVFPLFGVLFIIAGVVNALYHFRQATQEKRYSVLDVTDSETEPDPLNLRFGPKAVDDVKQRHRFCPYCGCDTEDEFRFCPSCGRVLPE